MSLEGNILPSHSSNHGFSAPCWSSRDRLMNMSLEMLRFQAGLAAEEVYVYNSGEAALQLLPFTQPHVVGAPKVLC